MPPSDNREELIRLTQNYSAKVDPSWKLDNFESEHISKINNLSIRGFRSKHGVINYLGVPYARLAARFRAAQLLDLETLSGTLDATLYGPRCPQGADVPHWMFENIFEKLGNTRRMSEMDCLLVNIYTPPDLADKDKLPVLVYVHGGAFSFGDSGPEQDGNHLVKRSMKLNKPIIVVSIAYRLSYFGFLSSKEILEDQAAWGEDPIKNQGSNDQRIALQWIQKYISHFGGDPARVTFSGESAGAHSVWQQIKGRAERLFSRAIVRSFPPGKQGSFEALQAHFDRIVAGLGINADAPGSVKVAAVRSLSSRELIEFWDGSAFPPVLDAEWMAEPEAGDTLGSATYWATPPDWLESIMCGCTRDEAILFCGEAWKNYTWKDAEESIKQALPSKVAQRVLESPAWKGQFTPLEALNAVVSDMSFIGAAIQGAELQAQLNKERLPVYFYIMEAADQHPGPLQGWAAHAADVATAFYQPSQQEFPEQAAVADKHTQYMLSYIYGQDLPGWPDVARSGGRYMAFTGPDSRMKHLHEDRKDREVSFSDEEERKIFYDSGFHIIGSTLKALNG